MSDEIDEQGGYIYHSTCRESCPENCIHQWKTYAKPDVPWEVDDTLMVVCGKS